MIRAMMPEDVEDVVAVVRAAFAAIAVPLDPAPSALRLTVDEVLAQEGGAFGMLVGLAGACCGGCRVGGCI